MGKKDKNKKKVIKKLKKINKKTRKEKKKFKKVKKKIEKFPDEINENDELDIDGVYGYDKIKEDDYMNDDYFFDEDKFIKDKFETYQIPETKEENSKHIKNLINNSDFIIELVDARNIKGTRNFELEKNAKNLIILINKIDLVSKKYLMKNINNLNDEFNNNNNNNNNNENNIKKNYILSINCCNRESIANFYTDLKNILINFPKKKKKKLEIGIVGYPNVGKESLINSIKLLEIANSDKKNIYFKENKLFGINSVFGTLFDNEESFDFISKKFKNVNDIENPLELIKNFVNLTDKEKIKKIYDIKDYKDLNGFLKEIGKKFDFDINDFNEIAKLIIQDCINGKITYEF